MQSAVVAGDGLGDRDVLVDGIGLGVGESASKGDGLGVEGEEGLFGPTEYYLPELLKVLSQVLKRRAIEFLNLDNVPGVIPSTLTSELSIMRDRDITGTTSRDAALQGNDSLAKKVGLA